MLRSSAAYDEKFPGALDETDRTKWGVTYILRREVLGKIILRNLSL